MLGKLMKYEFKASSRLFLLLYGALLLVSIVNSLMLAIGENLSIESSTAGMIYGVIQGILMFGYVILIAGTAIVTLIVIIMRFYKNLLGDEGYLMFTLPVSSDSQILSKFITSLIWGIVSTLVIAFSLLIVTFRYNVIDGIQTFFSQADAMGYNVPLWIMGAIVGLIVYFACVIMMFYCAMSIGPNMTKHRLLGSFLGYVILYIASQIVGLISLGVVYLSGTWAKFMAIELVNPTPSELAEVINSAGVNMFAFIVIVNLVMIAGYYIVTRYFIKNRLNLA